MTSGEEETCVVPIVGFLNLELPYEIGKYPWHHITKEVFMGWEFLFLYLPCKNIDLPEREKNTFRRSRVTCAKKSRKIDCFENRAWNGKSLLRTLVPFMFLRKGKEWPFPFVFSCPAQNFSPVPFSSSPLFPRPSYRGVRNWGHEHKLIKNQYLLKEKCHQHPSTLHKSLKNLLWKVCFAQLILMRAPL